MLLFVNACTRKNSRTKRLADCLLKTLGLPYEELKITDCEFDRADEDFLIKRDEILRQGDFEKLKYAKQFAEADKIVIAAPFWDLSFPAVLKTYIEQINAVGITFRYTPQGIPEGLCRADRLYYVTTIGGDFFPEIYGFCYIKALAENFYGIKDAELIKASGLDIEGADTEKILLDCEKDIIRRFQPNK